MVHVNNLSRTQCHGRRWSCDIGIERAYTWYQWTSLSFYKTCGCHLNGRQRTTLLHDRYIHVCVNDSPCSVAPVGESPTRDLLPSSHAKSATTFIQTQMHHVCVSVCNKCVSVTITNQWGVCLQLAVQNASRHFESSSVYTNTRHMHNTTLNNRSPRTTSEPFTRYFTEFLAQRLPLPQPSMHLQWTMPHHVRRLHRASEFSAVVKTHLFSRSFHGFIWNLWSDLFV